jgi:catechol 2,3-dioxygenase-like lactoylglutathione lyase family enzyme
MPRCYSLTLNTADVGKTRDFYRDTLGMELLAETPGRSVTFDTGAAPITFEELYKKPASYAELYFQVEDVPHFCKRLRLAGHDVPHEWSDKAELVDPDGRRVIVTEAVG